MLGVAILSLAFLQAATQQPQMGTLKPLEDKPAKCIVAGKVVSAVDGQPLKKATVQLMSQQPKAGVAMRPVAVTTDADGQFMFKDVEDGRYTLSFTRNGYARQTYGERVPGGPGAAITLVPGQEIKDIAVRLSPGAALSGKIVDEDSDPVAAVRVMLMRWGYPRGKRQLLPAGIGTTDDRGQYRVYGVAAGRYLVSATYTNFALAAVRMAGDSDETYAPTYYPGTNDVSQAMTVTVRAGDDLTGINFRLLPGKAVRVSGKVRLASGEPAKNVMVQMRPRGEAFVISPNFQMSDEAGNFTFPSILPGAYVLIASGSDQEGREFGRAEIEVGSAAVENVSVQLGDGTDIETEVRFDGVIDVSAVSPRLSLFPDDPLPVPPASAEIKEPGTVTLKRVLDGDYTVRVMPLPGDAYLSKAEFEEKDALAEGVKVHGGGKLSLTISAAGAHVEGNVVDAKNQPVAGAQVVLVPAESLRSRQDLYHVSGSDQYGHFVMRGVAPGSYKLFAWEAIDPGAYMDADFLKAYEDQGKKIPLSEGEHASEELKVIPSAKTGN